MPQTAFARVFSAARLRSSPRHRAMSYGAPGLPAVARESSAFARFVSEGWSGRRGSNPRPTAWKAVTLPLSYSRPSGADCPDPPETCQHSFRRRPAGAGFEACHERGPSTRSHSLRAPFDLGRTAESNGGEGRIRTSEGAWPTDLQSVAFDRSATSPGGPTRSRSRPRRNQDLKEPHGPGSIPARLSGPSAATLAGGDDGAGGGI